MLDDLRAAGADVLDERVVDDGDVITAGGLTAGLDLGLWLVEREAGAELAADVARSIAYEPARRGGTPLAGGPRNVARAGLTQLYASRSRG